MINKEMATEMAKEMAKEMARRVEGEVVWARAILTLTLREVAWRVERGKWWASAITCPRAYRHAGVQA